MRTNRRVAAMIWFLGLATIAMQALALSSRYFQPWLNADFIYPQLFAEDALAGRYPLAGWTLSSAPYFFPDMLVALGLRILGGSGTVLPAYVVLFYLALAVLAGWSLHRSTHAGWTAWLGGVAFVNALLLWQSVPGHAQYLWLLGTVGFHGGVILLGLANFALWSGMETDGISPGRRRAALGVMFLGTISDSLFLTQAALPLALGLWWQAGWRWRSPRVLTYLKTLGLALGLFLLVRGALLWGGYFKFSKVVRYAPLPSAIGQSTVSFVHDLFSVLVPQGWGLLVMAVGSLAVVAIGWWRERQLHRPLTPTIIPAMGLGLGGLLLTTLLPLITVYWRNATHVRYILPCLVWPTWLGLVWVLPKISRWGEHMRVLAILGLLWIGIGMMTAPQIKPAQLRWPYPESQAQLDDFLERHELRHGLSDYWHAHLINTLTHAPVRLFALRPDARVSFWNNNAFWFYDTNEDNRHLLVPEYTFIITDGLDQAALRSRFGEPAEQEKVGGLTLWLYSAPNAHRLTLDTEAEVRDFLRGRPGEDRIIDVP